MRRRRGPSVGFYIIAATVAILLVSLFGIAIYSAIHNYQEQQFITSGYIIDKHFTKAYTSYTSNSNSEDNSINIPVYHPAGYNIYIQSDDEKHKAWYEVTEYIYNQYKIGDYIKNVNRELK